ncbi:MAG: FAD-dependent oxidoreductase [Candidatus Poribacteria bacterium]
MSGRTRAVVLGASVAGLFAGRMLANFFDEVVLFDKEEFGEGVGARKAVPQGRHVHVILTPTYIALQRFLPGLVDELVANGASVLDAGRDSRVLIYGKTLTNGATQQPIIGSTRPFFEYHLRRYVMAVDGIEIKSGRRFEKWLMDDALKKVTGIVTSGIQGEQSLDADLVVDARGRGSTLIAELSAMGYGRPQVEQIDVCIDYTSREYRAIDVKPKWNFLHVSPYAPNVWKGGIIAGVEDDKWVVTQFGYFGDKAPADDNGFLQFARTLDAPDVADFLSTAEPVSEFCEIGTRTCRMIRFEKLDAFPDRLLAVADAVCSLNPIYGQGMTKAANEAVFLNQSLGDYLANHDSLDGFSDIFRRGLPDVGAEWAWQLTRAADLSFNRAVGKRNAGDKMMVRYMRRLLLRATENLDARSEIMDVIMLVKSPQSLMNPRTILRAMGL